MVWRGMWCGIMSEMVFDVKWCNEKCGGNDVMRYKIAMAMCIHSTSPAPPQLIRYFTSNHISGTAHHTTFHRFQYHQSTHHSGSMGNSAVWNLVWCGMFCNARRGMLCLIHPNVTVMWCNVEYVPYGAMLHVMCGVWWGVVKCDAMWDDGSVVMQDVKYRVM